MVDLFEEVEESLRADRLKAAGRKILPWALALVFGIVVIGGGLIAWDFWNKSTTNKASEAYHAILTAQGMSPDEAYTAFEDIAKKGPAGYKSLALSNQASIRMDQGREKDAVALWDKAAKVAPKSKTGKLLADAASLKAALVLLDEAPYADIEARLKPLVEEGRPYRSMAREALAAAKLNAGKIKEAREDFLLLTADLEAPEGIAQRANAAIALIDSGSGGSVAAAVKAAKTLPPPQQQMQLPPELLEQLQGMQMQGGPPQ